MKFKQKVDFISDILLIIIGIILAGTAVIIAVKSKK